MIDSHCHLDHEPIFSNLKKIIERSKNEGVEKLLTICTTLESYNNILKIINMDEIIYGTFGIHPHEADKNIITLETFNSKLKKNDKIIGIGETGLDFFYNNSIKDRQIESFELHIKAAIKFKLPIIIHSRSAENETYEILKKNYEPNLKILMHCFTGSKSFVKKLLDLDAYFSASGIITFKNSLELQDTFKIIPNEKLLIETDSPFLAPEPMRGKKNEPSYIKYTAQKLASLKKIEFQNLINFTTNNFNKLFFKA
tara:strand:- start:65 stop:829 length:765 start_codon:yes stop_codon:yes gene_type:complete